jgi:hypothetical protein
LNQADELRVKWVSLITEKSTSKWDEIIAGLPEESLPKPDEEVERLEHIDNDAIIDVAHWASRATFDIIGLAGFDYAFRALEDESEEVYSAYRAMFSSVDKGPQFKRIIELFFPIVEKLWPDEGIKTVNAALKVIKRRGTEMVRSKKEIVTAGIASTKEIWDKDLLSLLSECTVVSR